MWALAVLAGVAGRAGRTGSTGMRCWSGLRRLSVVGQDFF